MKQITYQEVLSTLPNSAFERLMSAQDQSRDYSRPGQTDPNYNSKKLPMNTRPVGIYGKRQ